MVHPTKKFAVSLIALIAVVALFATLSAAAEDRQEAGKPIINPAVADDASLRVAGDAPTAKSTTAIGFEGSAAPPR